jgi:hypothetical protein
MRTVIALGLLATSLHVASADPGGDVRVDVRCADEWATPDRGLTVTVDGVSYPALGTNGYSDVALLVYHHVATPYLTWTPTDIGFQAPPGPHRIGVGAPGCAALEQDVTVSPFQPAFLSGRLPISDDRLAGPTGAPNGFGIAFGAFSFARPAHGSSNDLFQTTYAYDATTVQGGSLTMSYERRAFAFASEIAFGTAPISGTSTYGGSVANEPPGPFAFAGSEYDTRWAMRFGARLPMHDIALAAGTGIGVDMIIRDANQTSSTFTLAMPPSGLDGDWFIPLWAQLTIKPSCEWGVQAYAAYDYHPTATGESAPTFGAGVIYQPSAACSEPAGLTVR